MPKVSIIIPIYNVEAYVCRCLDSILHQTYKDYEVILINDGSTDDTLSVVQPYADQNESIHIYSFANAGVSAARNRGIELSNGEYIMFIDSDDYIEPTMLEDMVNYAQKYNCDIVNCGYRIDFKMLRFYRRICRTGIMTSYEALDSLVLSQGMTNYPWGKLYRRSCFDTIRFPEDKTHFEDAYTIFKLLLHAQTIGNIGKRYYHYMHRNGSLTDQMDLETTYAMRKSFEYQEYYLARNVSDHTFHFDMQYFMADILILTTLIFYYTKKDQVEFIPASIHWQRIPFLFRVGYMIWKWIAEIKIGTFMKKKQEDFET